MLKQDRPGLVLIGTLLLILGTISLAVAISLRDNSGLFLPLIMLVAGLICLIAGISSMVSARKYNESIKEAYKDKFERYLKNGRNEIQNFMTGNGFISVGIHGRDYENQLQGKLRQIHLEYDETKLN